MIRAKIYFTVLWLSLHYSAILNAQPAVESGVFCLEFCDADSVLFSQKNVRPESGLGISGIKANIKGSCLDYFPGIKDDLLASLAYFPELTHIRIKVTYKSIHQTMNSRPSPWNVFRKKARRQYSVIINNNEGKHKGLSFGELSSNIKTGWFGHELAHICDYEKMNSFETFWFAFRYVFSKKFVRKIERNTDIETVKHGLAYPLYDGMAYLLNNSETDAGYREYSISNGLSLSEIKCFWCKYRMELERNSDQSAGRKTHE